MADAKRITIINQREGKLILPPAPEDLKLDPKAKPRVILSGHSAEVSAEEGAKLLRYKGVVDASQLVEGADSAEVKRLKAKIAAYEVENARLRKGKGAKADEADSGDDSETDDVDTGVLDAKKGVACLLPDGGTGVIQSVNKAKKTAKVKLDVNGNVSEFDVAVLKPVPAETAA